MTIKLSVAPFQVSHPSFVPAGTIVTIQPDAGATATVEYTRGSAADIQNNVASWSAWAKGAVSTATQDIVGHSGHLRVRALGGNVAVALNKTPLPAEVAALTTQDWGAPQTVSPRVAGALRMIANNGTVSVGVNGTTPGNGKIIDVQHPALADFIGVKLVYANYDTAAVMQINKAKVAPSPKHLSPNGDTLSWSAQVTFNGSPTAQVPQAVQGASAGNVGIVPGVLVSDFVAVSSIPRTDAGTVKLLRVRTHVNDNSYPLSMSGNPTMGYYNNDAAINGLQYGSLTFSGIPSEIETKASSVAETGGGFDPVAVIYYYSKPVKTIAIFGDSIYQGAGSLSNLIGWPERLTAASFQKASTLISSMNFAVSGQKHEDSHATLLKTLAQYRPQYAAFKAWSPNNAPGGTSAMMDACWARTLEAIEFCHQNGITPVVLTSLPVNGLNATDKGLVVAQNAKVMGLPSSVIKVDVATALSLNGNINPLYDADGTHPNDVGHGITADLVNASI